MAVTGALAGLMATAAMAEAAVVYDNVPSPLPGNVVSEAFQATSTSEFGGQIRLDGTERQDPSVKVTMSSWGCQSLPGGVCTSTAGATFSHPLTLNLYSVLPSGEPGGLIASVTQTFAIPYRPTSDPGCGPSSNPGGGWSPTSPPDCYSGIASNVTFDLSGRGISLPDRVIATLAYRTSNYGKPALGTQPCSSSPQGCPYDSLNVGLNGPPTVGSLPRPDDTYADSTWTGAYCDNGAAGTDALRLDPGCWYSTNPGDGDYQPAIQVSAVQTSGQDGANGVAGAVGGSKKCKKKGKGKKAAASAKKCKRKKK